MLLQIIAAWYAEAQQDNLQVRKRVLPDILPNLIIDIEVVNNFRQ